MKTIIKKSHSKSIWDTKLKPVIPIWKLVIYQVRNQKKQTQNPRREDREAFRR